jgi:putative Holliday junction resolvase
LKHPIDDFLKDYFSKEQVEKILVGEPTNWDDSDTHATRWSGNLLTA